MKKEELIKYLFTQEKHEEEQMSRRDAIKFMGISPIAAGVIAGAGSGVATDLVASDARGKVLIVGGGLAGMSTAARLSNHLSDPDITVIEPDPLSVSYQPGQTLVGGGIWEKEAIVYKRDDHRPDGITLIEDTVVEFDPDNKNVTTAGGQKVDYDYMIIATGLTLNYGAIKGLKGDITSAQADNGMVRKNVGKDGVCSIFFQDGATETWTEIQALIEKAKAHTGEEKLQALFTHPNTPIKCGGAPKKIMYLTDARLREAGVRDKVEMTFLPNGSSMFGVKEYHDAILQQFKERDFNWEYKTNLIAIDTENSVATFQNRWNEQGDYDEDLEEYDMIVRTKEIEKKYDFIHITPPMKAPDAVGNSKVGSGKGWVPVVKETLQHVKYKNVFCLGDVAAIPMGKTGGSVRKQYKVVVDNLISVMEAQTDELPAAYDGYTVCPLVTGLGTVMLAEFNWTNKPAPSFPLDPTQERWAWWMMKVYALKPMTIYGMLPGRA